MALIRRGARPGGRERDVIFLGVLGVALIIWSLWAGLGTHETNRARIFQGPVGTLASLIVIVICVVLMIVGFF